MTKKSWYGTEEQQALLANKGYAKAEDKNGDRYYIHDWLPIIWLYPDGAWRCEKGNVGDMPLEVYLKNVGTGR